MEIKLKSLLTLALISTALPVTAVTVNSDALSSADFTQQPPVLTAQETPLVMLGLSVDNQLFYKAYSDYTDIDSDGVLETTYDDTFDYYGYFQSGWCYTYNSTSNAFTPSVEAAGTNGHSCSDSWSGNFMNWATMTRVDVLRKVLYGGKRAVDESDSTILERAYIPSDVHAFAKVYSGSDIQDFVPNNYSAGNASDPNTVTLCNVSSAPTTDTTPSAPQLRVAKGDYRRWSINEGVQCQWDSKTNSPAEADRLNVGSEQLVRVEACVSGRDDGEASCKSYDSGNAKPVGLLQQYGENGDLKFGLISGSYDKYVAGGVLRKNIGLVGSNENPDDDEINLTTGVFTGVDGIISTVDAIRIIGWNSSSYNVSGDEGYDCGSAGISISDFESGDSPCRDWGNPVSEIYAEAVRYFSGATSASGAYSTDNDSTYIEALKEATWPGSLDVNPLNVDSRCASCSIIMISSGVASFDGDDYGSVSDIQGVSSAADLATKTNAVGTAEYGAFPKSFLIGEEDGVTDAANDGLCTSKSLDTLSKALGICPEAPGLQGSYYIAGLANHAKTADLREDTGMEGDQTVETYGVELAETVPSFDIPVSGGTIRFLPACQSASAGSGNWAPCSLFDVEIVSLTSDASGNLQSGTLLFHWEDSSWGNDYDLDGSQVISFCVGSESNQCADGNTDTRSNATYDIAVPNGQLRITQGVAYTAARFDLRFGYVVTGSQGEDGISDWLVRPGNENRNDLCQLDETGSDGLPLMPIPGTGDSASVGCGSDTKYEYIPVSELYSPNSSGADGLLDKPLSLASKYGGFRDLDGSGDPTFEGSATDTREWDLVNNRTGANGADGVPDNYFFSSNPGLLANQLQRVFEALVARTASGTNAAVVANSSSGVGAVYQALYQPQYSVGNKTVTWTGTLRAIFIDDFGYLREDSNGNDQLDNYETDKIVQLEFDPNLEKTFVQRYTLNADMTLTPDGLPVDLGELNSIWNAVDQLAAVSTPEQQRTTYASADASRRYILTAADRNDDGEVDQNDVLVFDNSQASNLKEFMGLPAASDDYVEDLIDYLRGKELPGFRARSIDYDDDGVEEVWRLGDIIHSTPAVVATPKDNYGTLYSDSTYEDFVELYRNRRQVIYVGANDGMIHAFNGGYWNAATRQFLTQPVSGTAVNHPLGQELWAYTPANLLPHLRWLGELDYQHVYYMDGEPLVFDANIFPEDATHPHGWGTVMVMGMRLGGSPLEVEVDGAPKVARSAYVVFDVTDPEQPPVLLGEVTSPELGFTLAKPALIKNRQPSTSLDSLGDWESPSVNDWYLVLGSGPRGANATTVADSDQAAKVFAIDLKQLVDNSASTSATAEDYFVNISGVNPLSLGTANGFVGGIEVTDWDLNNSDDAVYVTTIDNAVAGGEPGGRLYRLLVEDNQGSTTASYGVGGAQVSQMMNVGQPVQSAPTTVRDTFGDRWVLFGTGKLIVPADNELIAQQYFYGIKEPRDSSTGDLTYGAVTSASLVDTTDVGVFEGSGDVRDLSTGAVETLTIGTEEVDDFSELESVIRDYPGWKRRMQYSGLAPSGRVTGSATLNPADRQTFAFTEYVPPALTCELDGDSFLYVLSVLTGTSTPYAPLSTTDDFVENDRELSLSVIGLGKGFASEVTFHQGGSGTVRAITNMSTGAIGSDEVITSLPKSGRQSWRQIETTSF
ncbi:MAG: pilus assembly protein [Marinobacter sp.]|uniref:pilus assembly protein n=1 Tax=Marinobacter sp. TaxID=50741 RepID=UPI003C356D04